MNAERVQIVFVGDEGKIYPLMEAVERTLDPGPIPYTVVFRPNLRTIDQVFPIRKNVKAVIVHDSALVDEMALPGLIEDLEELPVERQPGLFIVSDSTPIRNGAHNYVSRYGVDKMFPLESNDLAWRLEHYLMPRVAA